MIEVLFGLDRMTRAQLDELQERLRAEQRDWRARRKQASGCVVSKGAGRRSAQLRVRLLVGRRDSKALGEADVALQRLSRLLGYIEKELYRRATSESPARA